MQQKISSTDKGLQIARIFSAFSMFPLMMNPMKYGWAMIPANLAMIYFASKKYKEEKQAGIEHSKYGMISIMLSVAVFVMILVTIAYYLGEAGYI